MSNFQELLLKVKEFNNILEFNEMQVLALKEEYLNKNLVISSPTSSGKTLVAEIYMLNTILEKRKRVIFISPLKALTYEHYKNFKKKYENFDLKIGLSTGDLDSSAKYLENYQIIFLTFEKLDSLIRHKANWLHTLGLIVIDEIHNLDSDRGATLETIIVELMLTIKNLQVIGLSATIPNAKELASWLNAQLIYSEYRPVKLDKGVILDNEITLQDKKYLIEQKNSSLESVIFDTLEKNKQALVFTNTRKTSEGLSKKLQTITKKYLSLENKKYITKAINEIDNYIQTDYDREIINNILNGVAFHHAGLREALRNIIEDLFKLGHIKIIVSTPTLAAGVNLPAYRVIIHTTYRHGASGMHPIPIKEYLQMSGRAGRKGLDDEGEALLIAKDDLDLDSLFERYVNASPEEVDSQLGYIPTLRTMILSLIANEFIYNDDSLEKFFKNTFYAIRFQDLNNLFYKIETILRELESYNFIKIENKFVKITELGRRVSELYIDPLSAHNIITKLKVFDDLTDKELMMLIVNTLELRPWIMPSKTKLNELEIELQENYKEFGLFSTELYDDYEILEKYFTCKIFLEWISETSEQDLLDNYNLLPGILHTKVYIAEWISYAVSELSKILNKDLITKKAIKMQKRIKDGIKEELLLLIELPNIGRARARKLFINNIKTISDIKNVEPQLLINILGLKVAQKLLEHLKVEFDVNTIFIPREQEDKKLLKKDQSKATKKVTEKKIKTEAKLQKGLFDY
jgi:helicase